MAALNGNINSNDARKLSSAKLKNRENARNILCKNMTLSGNCRVQGCPYNHDLGRFETNPDSKKFLSVDSPSFTPLAPSTNTQSNLPKALGISPKAAAAAIFTPKGAGKPVAPPPQSDPHDIPEFVPQQRFTDFQPSQSQQTFDPFAGHGIQDNDHVAHPQLNPYAQDGNTSMYPTNTSTYNHPLNYHLYAPVGPHRDNLLPYQRTVHDLFISDHLREELQRKADAALQTFASSVLPTQVDHFHSLVLLDTNINKPRSHSGYVTRLYKAVSTKDGYTYCLRRLEGFRLTDEKAVSTIQIWKRINHGSVVSVHDAFTTRAFGDSSLIVVTDYYPLSQTLAERLPLPQQTSARQNHNRHSTHIPASELWSYVVQLASALKVIHSSGLAARVVNPAKALVTSKGRVRLNTCGVLDIALYEPTQDMGALQSQDLTQLGQTFLCLANRNTATHKDPKPAIDQAAHVYGDKMRQALSWLLLPGQEPRTIEAFLTLISEQVLATLDASLHESDNLTSTLGRELENARLVRLLTKINLILERPSTPTGSSPNNSSANHNTNNSNNTSNASSTSWSETGERYYLKLFRDYVFHQVDTDGRPVLDLGHVLSCLNRLDAGIDERVMLVSRDEQNCFLVSFRELKRGFESAWHELLKASSGTRRL